MEYKLDVNNESMNLDVQLSKGDKADVVLGDAEYSLEFKRISNEKLFLTVDGRQVTAWVKPTEQGKLIILNGQQYVVLDQDAQDQAGTAKKKSSAGQEPDTVTPPMPAIVIQVPVSQGDMVKKGDTVVVVSAMKMETSLKAPYSGKVSQISVAEGDKVMPGDILVDIEKVKDEETV